MKKVIIIGAGGNSKVVLDILRNQSNGQNDSIQIVGVLDDDQSKTTFQGLPIIGSISKLNELQHEEEVFFINGIGNNGIRKKIFETYPAARYITAIHPSAILGSNVMIEAGTVIMPGVIINVDSKIGKQVIINTGAIIEHDNVIEDFVHVASGAATAGNVRIGECSMLGTGVKVIQGIKIGAHTIIGAGGVVVTDIPDHCIAVGVPARVR